MSEVFFISDRHFGHRGIITFSGTKPFRPFATIEEHDAELVRRWNSIVGNKDIVWHLADYLQYFTRVQCAVEFEGAILTHVPVHPSQFSRYFMNVHGYLHADALDNSRYFNVSCERINLTPIPWDEILNRWAEHH